MLHSLLYSGIIGGVVAAVVTAFLNYFLQSRLLAQQLAFQQALLDQQLAAGEKTHKEMIAFLTNARTVLAERVSSLRNAYITAQKDAQTAKA